ncbi:MAG: divalent-cation tolerance protein CutA [Saprospiraceae bacterium]
MSFTIFYTTHADEDSAKTICNQLLKEKLIACSNVFPMKSDFSWQGEIQHENEMVAIMKTSNKLRKKVEKRIAELHSYEVPAILHWRVKANKSYEKWIKEVTK